MKPKTQQGRKTIPTACCYSNDGRWCACACQDGSIQIWDHNKNFVSLLIFVNCIHSVMVSVHASSVVDRGFEPRLGQTKDYTIGICCFSGKHAALRNKSRDWLSRSQDNMSKWSDMSIRRLLFQ